jgi:hypothetical protein
VAAPKDESGVEPWMNDGKLFVSSKFSRVNCKECLEKAKEAK